MSKEGEISLESSLPPELARQYERQPRVYSRDGDYLGRDLAASTETSYMGLMVLAGAVIGGILELTRDEYTNIKLVLISAGSAGVVAVVMEEGRKLIAHIAGIDKTVSPDRRL